MPSLPISFLLEFDFENFGGVKHRAVEAKDILAFFVLGLRIGCHVGEL